MCVAPAEQRGGAAPLRCPAWTHMLACMPEFTAGVQPCSHITSAITHMWFGFTFTP